MKLCDVRYMVKKIVKENYEDSENFTVYYDSENKKVIDSEFIDRYNRFFITFVESYTEKLTLNDKSYNIFLDSEDLDSDDIFDADGGDYEFLRFYAD